MPIHLTPTDRVTCTTHLTLPLSTSAAWGQLRDLPRYAAHDFFHTRVTPHGPPRAGTPLTLNHRFLFFSSPRTGRILRWHEGAGYAFSDLSPRGPRHAFPHTFSYHLTPLPNDHCRLTLSIHGRWTLTLLPRPLTRLWLLWTFNRITTGIRNDLLTLALHHRHRSRPAPLTTAPNSVAPTARGALPLLNIRKDMIRRLRRFTRIKGGW